MARYFTLKELCASDTAKARGIDNFPSFEVAANLELLTRVILDPLREAWGSAINVTSGYRCPDLNKAVGGSSTSVHPYGWAADIKPKNGRFDTFVEFTKQWLDDSQTPYDQLIREKKGKSVWMHIGLYGPKGQQRRQYLEIVK